MPQTPYMASSSEPMPVKREPLSFRSTGVEAIPRTVSRAQSHNDMSVQDLVKFSAYVDLGKKKGAGTSDAAETSAAAAQRLR